MVGHPPETDRESPIKGGGLVDMGGTEAGHGLRKKRFIGPRNGA